MMRTGFRNKADEQKWAKRALVEVTRFVTEQDMSVKPIMLEAPIETKVTPGLILRGRVDRVDKELDQTLHIIDYKTGLVSETVDWTQLELRSLIVHRILNIPVTKMSYLYLLSASAYTRELTEEALRQVKWDPLHLANEIRAEKEYPPSPGPACAACGFAVICPPRHEGFVQLGDLDLPLWRDFSDILFDHQTNQM